eukprot:2139740-Pyramimonas_sp.AAC.1
MLRNRRGAVRRPPRPLMALRARRRRIDSCMFVFTPKRLLWFVGCGRLLGHAGPAAQFSTRRASRLWSRFRLRHNQSYSMGEWEGMDKGRGEGCEEGGDG